MKKLEPVWTSHLFRPLHLHLMEVLESLGGADWQRPTACKEWAVRDIAAHILDTQLRLISFRRDQHLPPPPELEIDSYEKLVCFLNGLNADWVKAMRRLSPPVLFGLLRGSGEALADHIETLDLHAPAHFPVAWAGETASQQWFDIGRDYTEYWHHQQQIRDAVGAVPLTQAKWLNPVLRLFVRSVPVAYREETGGRLDIRITGEAGGCWAYEVKGHLYEGSWEKADAKLTVSDDTAWRMFTKGINPEVARERAQIEGNAELAAPFFRALAVMA